MYLFRFRKLFYYLLKVDIVHSGIMICLLSDKWEYIFLNFYINSLKPNESTKIR